MKKPAHIFFKIFLMILFLSCGDKVIGMQGPDGEDRDPSVTQRVNVPGDRAPEDVDEEDIGSGVSAEDLGLKLCKQSGDDAEGKGRKESATSVASARTGSSDGYDADSSHPPSAAGSGMLLVGEQPMKLRWTQGEIFTSDTLSAETITPQFRSAVEALMKILYDDFVAHKKSKLREGRRFWQSEVGREEATEQKGSSGGVQQDSESEEEEVAQEIKSAVAGAVGSRSLKPEPFKEPIPHIIHTLMKTMRGPGVTEAVLLVVRDYEGIIGSRRDIRPFISQFFATAVSSRYSARTHAIPVVGLLDD